jgi:hypothetical protein
MFRAGFPEPTARKVSNWERSVIHSIDRATPQTNPSQLSHLTVWGETPRILAPLPPFYPFYPPMAASFERPRRANYFLTYLEVF